MVNATRFAQDFDSLVTKNGQPIRIRYYTVTYSGADYDQQFVTPSGSDVWCYGMSFNLDKKTGGEDRSYLEQGLIILNDSKIYIPGSIPIDSLTKLMFGSPAIGSVFAPISNGWFTDYLSGVPILKKVYIRLLNNGSFIGEF